MCMVLNVKYVVELQHDCMLDLNYTGKEYKNLKTLT